jgi:DJ-1/PfpI family
MPKILIVTGDAAESLEVMYPYQRLLEEGYQIDIAAPSVKKLQFVVHDFTDGFDTYTEKPGYTWQADVAFADVDPAGYAALVIPGGRALAAAGTLGGRRSAAYPALAPASPRPAPSSSTAPPSWTGRWCRHGPGPTTRRGCASSSRSCAPRRPPEPGPSRERPP